MKRKFNFKGNSIIVDYPQYAALMLALTHPNKLNWQSQDLFGNFMGVKTAERWADFKLDNHVISFIKKIKSNGFAIHLSDEDLYSPCHDYILSKFQQAGLKCCIFVHNSYRLEHFKNTFFRTSGAPYGNSIIKIYQPIVTNWSDKTPEQLGEMIGSYGHDWPSQLRKHLAAHILQADRFVEQAQQAVDFLKNAAQ